MLWSLAVLYSVLGSPKVTFSVFSILLLGSSGAQMLQMSQHTWFCKITVGLMYPL